MAVSLVGSSYWAFGVGATLLASVRLRLIAQALPELHQRRKWVVEFDGMLSCYETELLRRRRMNLGADDAKQVGDFDGVVGFGAGEALLGVGQDALGVDHV